jgi:hypothetical protein
MEIKPLAQPGMAFVHRSQYLQPLGLAGLPYHNAPSLRLWLLVRALFSRGAAFMHCSKYIIMPIAALTLIAEMGFGQGSTITSLNTQDTPGTPATVTVTGATAPSSFANQTLTLNYLGGIRSLSSYVTSQGTFQSIQVGSAITLRRNPVVPTPANNVIRYSIVSFSGNTFNLAGPFVG